MYAKGMSQRDIADTIEDIYGFEISHETISNITDNVIETAEEWQNRPLKKFYTFLFVDCLYVSIRKEMETKSCAVYVILGYDVNGVKDILGLWIGEAEGKHYWMQIFDEIKARGVEDVLFISMDGVSGLEEGAHSIFKDVTVQRCIVHLIRNSVKYIPSKDYNCLLYTSERSGYNCIWTDAPTDEWLLTLSDDIVTSCSRTGGSHGWQLFSVSRWNKDDGRKLKEHLEYEFDVQKNRQIYWDDIALFCHPEDYQLGIQTMHTGDIIEIDNLQELADIDQRYAHYLNGGNTNE